MEYIKGRGAQINTPNRFHENRTILGDVEALDELPNHSIATKVRMEYPKSIVNKVDSPDTHMVYSMNPYQGCEHGCIYCYARNTHNYYGLSAGLDFEQQIFAKPDAPLLLKKFLNKKSYRSKVISLSGNTDCYQPIESKLRITRSLLETLLEYRNPVSIITKNELILRDIEILKQLAEMNLVQVMISLTTLNDALRRKMEPRTSTGVNRLKIVEKLSENGIPVGVMTAPLIPGLNTEEIPALIKAAAEHGAKSAGYIIARLNGDVREIFHDWLNKNFPDRADKVWHQLQSCHGGTVSDHRVGKRMKGEGSIASAIQQLHRISVKKYLSDRSMPEYSYNFFRRPNSNSQLELF